MWGRSKRKHSSLITHSLPRAQTQPRAHNIERANCSQPQQDGPKTNHPIAEPCNTPSGNVPAPRHRGLPCYTSAPQRSSKLQTRRLMASHLGEESAAPNHKNTGCRLHNAVSVGSGVGVARHDSMLSGRGGGGESVRRIRAISATKPGGQRGLCTNSGHWRVGGMSLPPSRHDACEAI